MLAECPAEISRVIKSNLSSYVCDTRTRVAQQRLGFFDAVAIQVLHWAKSQLLLKDATQVIFAHADRFGHLQTRKTLCIILLHIGNRLFDQGAGGLREHIIAQQDSAHASGGFVFRQDVFALEHDLGMIQALDIFG